MAARISDAMAIASAGLVSFAARPFSTRWAMMCGFRVALLGSRSGRILPP